MMCYLANTQGLLHLQKVLHNASHRVLALELICQVHFSSKDNSRKMCQVQFSNIKDYRTNAQTNVISNGKMHKAEVFLAKKMKKCD